MQETGAAVNPFELIAPDVYAEGRVGPKPLHLLVDKLPREQEWIMLTCKNNLQFKLFISRKSLFVCGSVGPDGFGGDRLTAFMASFTVNTGEKNSEVITITSPQDESFYLNVPWNWTFMYPQLPVAPPLSPSFKTIGGAASPIRTDKPEGFTAARMTVSR